MWDLSDIIDFQMNAQEAKAYKLSLLWMELAQHEFPDYQHTTLRRKGDPRKSLLFKYCYKLISETKDLVPDAEYRLYILAQLQILKYVAISKDHGLIDPIILVGDKAWRRWKVWKSKFDQHSKKVTETSGSEPMKVVSSSARVINDIKRTKNFLIEKFGGPPTLVQIAQALKDHTMVRWVTFNKVSPYYILMSPYVSKCLNSKTFIEVFMFDLKVYEDSITDNVRAIFQEDFPDEFR